MLNPIEGEIFCVDKPLHWTSFAVVKKIRSCLRRKLNTPNIRVGHAGTLDPLASGVLIVCTGRKTKTIETLQAGVKEYIAEMKLGETTPSFDMETEVDATYEWRHITRQQMESTLKGKFIGVIEQVPPKFSACKIDGKPAYVLARMGENVEMKAKTLVIDDIELLDCGLPDDPSVKIRVVCSKGTYIRALARDIGMALGSGAHLTSLRRTRVGDVKIETCVSLESLLEKLDNEQYVMPEEAEDKRIMQERISNQRRAREMKLKRAALKIAKQARPPQID